MTLSTLSTFSVALPKTIHFGRGTARALVKDVTRFGSQMVLVHGANARRSDWLREALLAQNVAVRSVACPGEPTLDQLEETLGALRGAPVHAVIMLGGGAVLDFGKALAALLPTGADPRDHLEVVGKALPLAVPPLPSVAIPTTAGTGAEVTRNAVLSVPDRRVKVSLRDPGMIPDMAIVDPALTDGCPRSVTLASGLDAITQVIEPFLCTAATPFTDALCRDAIPRGLAALVRLMAGEEPEARDNLALCSLYGGVALANAGLGAVHGLAGPLGGWTGGAHGVICGALLPHVLAANETRVQDTSKARIGWLRREIAAALGCDAGQAFASLASWSKQNGLPGLADLGLLPRDFATIAGLARQSSSMRKNPVALTEADLVRILQNEAG